MQNENPANDNIRDEYNHSADAMNALFNQMMKAIPEYATTTDHIRGLIDDRMAELDTSDMQTALDFGKDSQDARKGIVDHILEIQEGDALGFLRDPLKETLDTMNGFNLEEIGGKIARLADKGGAVIKRNPGMAAATAVAGIVLSPLALFGGAAAIAAKEKVRSMKQGLKPETIEQLESQIRDGIANFKPMVRKLEAAQAQIPQMRETIAHLGRANMQCLIDISVCIAAGREKVRQITTVQLPECTDAYESGNLERYARTLGKKVTILEQARSKSIIDVSNLASSMDTVNENDLTFQSILDQEIMQHRSSLAANAVVADNLRLGLIIEDFRKSTEKGTAQAIKATQAARKVALSNQVDSPERLQAMLKNMDAARKVVESAYTALPGIEKKKLALKNQVEKSADKLVEAQANSARHAAGVPALGNSTSSAPRLNGPDTLQ